ncbi:glucuronosyltransferase [Caenorhabditis elegans]|uniref:glucuronosyltransferase n=1 Tax=Caenorhabditis elegans TaxID=6239 RepID=O17123_CAEEL|nr:glucuronosyltransferase [Caenorhabditis elegans]CCD70335.1 glucuronosyltransferase [Caenorhabditis elegans]|eukprot:NP_503278.2 UDP-GlucuronosylTransferase [Caenorhabditis elegans]
MNLLILLIFVFLISNISGFNYLVVSPAFGHSHSTFMGKLADALTEAGHNVTVLSIIVSSKFRNISYTKLTKDIVVVETTNEQDQQAENMENNDFSRYWTQEGTLLETIPSYLMFTKMSDHGYETFRNHALPQMEYLKSHRPRYDAVFFESYLHTGKAIQEYLEIPVFLPVTSLTHDYRLAELIGEPVSPSYLSGYFTNFGNIMNFQERVINTLSYYLAQILISSPNWKTLQDPSKDLLVESEYYRAPYVFINSNPYIDFPRPLLSKTIEIGGITVDADALKSEKVDETWNNILKRRPHNVLISFGTMFKSIHMPDSYKNNMVKVMKSFKNVTFIWKYESEETSFANGAENIIFKKWTPQTALLADSRLSAFFTHGGLGSVNELSYLGKPALLCPLFADQVRNSKMLSRHNGSIEISKFNLESYNTLRSALHSILFDESYAENAEKLAKKLEFQPAKPKELFVRHAEFAARFGEQPALDCNLRTMGFATYHLLDVVVCLTSFVVLVILSLVVIIRKIVQSLAIKMKRD